MLFMYPPLPESSSIYGVRLETVGHFSYALARTHNNPKPVVSPVFSMYEGGTAYILMQSVKRWAALSRYLDDGAVPIDNNWAENQIPPRALGGKNWLFAGSLRSGKRAAAIMSLIQSARLNGHDRMLISKMCWRGYRYTEPLRSINCYRTYGTQLFEYLSLPPHANLSVKGVTKDWMKEESSSDPSLV